LLQSSVSASIDTKPLLVLVSDATLISLSANFMNLLDLRPARSAKAFLTSFILLLLGDCRSFARLVPAGFAGAVLAGICDELNEKSMMGDAGANPLGAVLGYWVALPLVSHCEDVCASIAHRYSYLLRTALSFKGH